MSGRVEQNLEGAKDRKQIDEFIELLFSEYNDRHIFFDEFVQLAESCTSELFVGIYEAIYSCIPCAQTFLLMRYNYKRFL